MTITVQPPNAPPTVSMTSPPKGAVFTVPATVTLKAGAAHSDGTVAKVLFFVNGSLVGTDTTAPYTVGWSTSTTGTYTLTARAIDNSGAGATSAPVSIAVRRRR